MKNANATMALLLVSILTSAIPVGAQQQERIAGQEAQTGQEAQAGQSVSESTPQKEKAPGDTSTQAAPAIGSWDGLKALAPKEALVVTLKDGSTKKGKLSDITDTALTVSQGKKTEEIGRAGIFRVYRSVSKSRKKETAIGAAAGGGLGVLTATFGDGSSGHGVDARAAVIGVLFMAGVGALIGRGIASGHERVLIYEARR